jgi:hypothetical protein
MKEPSLKKVLRKAIYLVREGAKTKFWSVPKARATGLMEHMGRLFCFEE